MDFTVKDLDSQINAAMPEPKFSIGSNWKIVLRKGFQIGVARLRCEPITGRLTNPESVQ